VHERTGGNAFLVTELLDQLDASGATELAAPPGVAGGPPPTPWPPWCPNASAR
jgi:hypothetical protein